MDSISYYTVYIANIFTNHGKYNISCISQIRVLTKKDDLYNNMVKTLIGMYTPFAQYSFRILSGALLLTSLVLVNSYSSIVVSSLTVSVMEQAINSFEDLAASKSVFLLLRKDIAIGRKILVNDISFWNTCSLINLLFAAQEAESGVYKILGDEIRQHSDRVFLNHADLFQKLENGPYAYPYVSQLPMDN